MPPPVHSAKQACCQVDLREMALGWQRLLVGKLFNIYIISITYFGLHITEQEIIVYFVFIFSNLTYVAQIVATLEFSKHLDFINLYLDSRYHQLVTRAAVWQRLDRQLQKAFKSI